mgnify:CR=1 FL=1
MELNSTYIYSHSNTYAYILSKGSTHIKNHINRMANIIEKHLAFHSANSGFEKGIFFNKRKLEQTEGTIFEFKTTLVSLLKESCNGIPCLHSLNPQKGEFYLFKNYDSD